MTNEILFSERQRFNQWWLWVILAGINGLFLYGFIQQVILGQQFGSKPMGNTGLFILTGMAILFTLGFRSFRLVTQIKEDGIYVRFFPFHMSFKHYEWETLTKVYLRKYSALREFGGWGIRYGLSNAGTAYNVSGNQGLQLEFTTGKKLLIGTNKTDELTKALNKIGQLKQK